MNIFKIIDEKNTLLIINFHDHKFVMITFVPKSPYTIITCKVTTIFV